MALDEEAPLHAMLPTGDESEIGWCERRGVVAHEALAQVVICPQGVAERHGITGLQCPLVGPRGEHGEEPPLLVDVAEQGEPDTIKARGHRCCELHDVTFCWLDAGPPSGGHDDGASPTAPQQSQGAAARMTSTCRIWQAI